MLRAKDLRLNPATLNCDRQSFGSERNIALRVGERAVAGLAKTKLIPDAISQRSLRSLCYPFVYEFLGRSDIEADFAYKVSFPLEPGV